MNITVPADLRLRTRAILIALTMTLVGLVSLYLFRRFLSEMDALATASPQLAFEQLHPVGTAALIITLFSAPMLAGVLTYASLCVSRWAMAPSGMACHLGNAAPHGTTGVNGGPVLLVTGSSGHGVWRADPEFTRAGA
jgi:hypothetical protein